VTTTIDLGILIREPADAYHAKAGEYLTSHLLADFRKCPFLYHQKRLDLVADGDRPAYLVGRAAHTLILEGRERFDAEYAIGGPINPNTGKPYGKNTKTFAAWAEAQGKPVLSHEQAELIERMAAAVKGHEAAMTLLSDGMPEGVVRTEYGGVLCQARLDWLSPGQGLVDLKTADDIDYFECDARRYGYLHQLAFYQRVLAGAADVLAPVHFVAAEKHPPHRVGLWRADQDSLNQCAAENEAAIRRLTEYDRTDTWPTLYESPLVLTL